MNHATSNQQARLFFALWPDEAERQALVAWQTPLQRLCGGRAMRSAGLHATLVFLGEVGEERFEALLLAAQEVNGERFGLKFALARYWGHNHIVFAAPLEVPPALLWLVSELERRLRRHHFRFEARSYKPHVTLLRHAQWSDSPLPVMSPLLWRARDFALVQSLNDAQGARYEVLARFPLHGTGDA